MLHPGATAARADENFVTHATWALQHTPGMTSDIRPDLVIADSGLACDTFNFICRARLQQHVRARVADAIAWFSRRERPFSWWVGPADEPPELGAVLEDAGLERAESELAMSVPLDGLPGMPPPVAGFDVRRVRTGAELDTLAQLLASNWTPPDADVLAFYRRAAPALLDPSAPQRFYVGYVDGEPAATAEATVHERTAGLYNISTRVPFRGRGIGSMMTWHPLRDARADGCDLAVLQAAPAGVGLYRRLGFAAFGEITEYKPGRPRG